MKRFALPLACALVLSACSAPQMAALGTRAALSPETVARLVSVCQAVGPLLSASSAPGLPAAIRETAIPANAFCVELTRGVLPETSDDNTLSWLSKIVAVLGK